MIKINSFVVLILALLAISCTQSSKNSWPSGDTHVNFVGKNSKYKFDFHRNVTHKLKLIKQVDFDLGQLLEIKAFDDKLIGLDYKSSKLFFFNDNLDTTFTFGKSGDGPKENNGIMSFEYTGNGLTLYDFGHRSIKKYTIDSSNKDSLAYSYRFPNGTGIYRVIHLNNNKYLYTFPLEKTKDLQFEVIDSTNINTIYKRSIYDIMNSKTPVNYPEMALDGTFLSNPNSKFVVYACSFTGMFFSFERENFKNVYHTKTIDRTPIPKAAYKTIAPGTSHLEIVPNTTFFPSSALSNDKLYLLNKITDDNSYIVDIYNVAEAGKYIGSFYIPKLDDGQEAISIAVVNQMIYVLYEDLALVKYSIQKF